MKKHSKPKSVPPSLHKLEEGDNLVVLRGFLDPNTPTMIRSPSKVKMPNGIYGPEQSHFKDERERQEISRLRRLADVRAAVYSNRPAIPPRPQGSPASTPNLHHDFATKTHLARLDVAYEKLDAYVEKSVEQLIAAMKEQRQGLEERMDSRLENFDERITLVVNTANETRSALDTAIGDLARSRHTVETHEESPADTEMRAKLAACETRLQKLETSTAQVSEQSQRLSTALDAAIGDLKQSSGKAIEADMQSKFSDARIKAAEERIEKLESAANSVGEQTRVALDAALDDMARQSNEKSAAIDMQAKISDTRAESLQVAVADLSARIEGEQLRTKIFDTRVEGLQTSVAELGKRVEEVRTGGNLQRDVQSHISDLNSRLEAEQVRTTKRLESLQEQLVGSMATSGRMSVLEERVTAVAASANEARTIAGEVRATAGDIRHSLDRAIEDMTGKLETRTTKAETASADTIAKAVDDRIASIDSLQVTMQEIASRLDEEQARAWKRIDDVQEGAVSKSYIDERLNVIEWVKAEQLRGTKRLDDLSEQLVSKAYIDERLHANESRLHHLENARQQDNTALLTVPQRQEYDDVCRRLDSVEKCSGDVQELRWRQEAFTSNLDMLARRLQDQMDQSAAADAKLQEAMSKESLAKEASIREAAEKELMAREAAAKEAVKRETAEREAERVAIAREAAARSAAEKDAIVREAAAKVAADKDAIVREAAAKALSPEAVSSLMKECVVGIEHKITNMQKRLNVCAPLEIVTQLRARVDGGFDAIVVQLEATRWMLQKTEETGDHIMQAFVLNVNSRLHKCEDIITQMQEYIKKHKHSSRHHHTGQSHHSSHNRSSRSQGSNHSTHSSKATLQRSATKAAIEQAEKRMLRFCWDVWAEGSSPANADSA